MITVEEKVNWAKEQVKSMEIMVRGFGFEAIQAKVKLKHIKSLNDQEFTEAAIASYNTQHGITE